ncbi:MAG TPA: hypothetical protein PLP61_01695 [Nocardioides sp.]|uniref:hypothetical protein n=1 Tax=Nocardioides sp. TaxID=35761 RepID=UPI002BA9EC2C|nr:hypothetical protein [Nocardioides sp.]HQR25726.1 hypothetical protein [Nocardioides sp.]
MSEGSAAPAGYGSTGDLGGSDDILPGSGQTGTARELDWWHRDHPTFTALTGFFSGLLLVTLLPGIFVALMSGIFDERTAEEAFPFVLLAFAVPLGLLAFPRTRRFGKYLLLGMVVTLLIVFGVGTIVFWLMLRFSA